MKNLIACTVIIALFAPVVSYAHGYGHVMGTIDTFENDTLVLTSTEGESVTVKLTDTTKVMRGKTEGGRDDIVAGSRVVVHFAKDKTAAEIHLPAGE